MIEFLRRKMHWFIYAIVAAFVLSLFLGSASLFWFNSDLDEAGRIQRVKAQQARDRGAKGEDEGSEDGLDLQSKKVAARVTLDGHTGFVTEGDLHRTLKEQDIVRRAGGKIPPQFMKFLVAQALNAAVDERLLAMNAEAAELDVRADVDTAVKNFFDRMGPEGVKKMGVKEPELRKTLTERIRYQKLLERVLGGRRVPDTEAQAYYEAAKDEFKTADGKGIRSFDQAKDEIVKKLRAHLTDGDVKAYYEQHKDRWRQADKATFRRLVVDGESAARLALTTFTAQELDAYYRANQADFMGAMKFRISHVMVDPQSQAYTSRSTVTDDDLAQRYEESKDEYYQEEQVKTANILIACPAADVTTAAALKRAEEALARLKKGEDFAAVARAVSQDELTKERGGEGGFWSRGMKGEEVETAVFDKAVGQVAGPVRSGRGFEVFKMLEKKAAVHRTLDDVRGELRETLAKEKAVAAAEAELKSLRDRVESGSLTFADAARQFSQAPSKDRGGALAPLSLGENKGVADLDEVGEAGFLDFAIQGALRGGKAGALLDPIRSSKGMHLVRIEEVIPPSPTPLADCRRDVELKFRKYRSDESAHKDVLEAATKLQAGTLTFPDAVAAYSDGADKADGGLWKDVVLAEDQKAAVPAAALAESASENGLNRKLIAALSGLKDGEVSRPFKLGTRWHLVKLERREPPTFKALDDEMDKQIRFALAPDVPEAELRTHFKDKADQYRTPAKTVIQHLLCRSRDVAEGLLRKALAGEDFGGLVRAHSEDLGSRKQDGEIAQELLPANIKEAVEKVEPGKVVPEILQTAVGFHLVKLVKREQEAAPNFDQAKEKIREELLRPKLNELLQSYLGELRRRAVVETWDGPENPLQAGPDLEATGGLSATTGTAR